MFNHQFHELVHHSNRETRRDPTRNEGDCQSGIGHGGGFGIFGFGSKLGGRISVVVKDSESECLTTKYRY